ncbi:hypothetical protein [Xanthomonas euroxanthea]|uniref:hypothetical protein n=1 Tax=Xanthomonas euroxanthea TaxID=2259622 RepID=UPI0016191E66|nr:hypothetical protein [Xanthomonas euroxanthea]MBB5766518.1 hypothetical protein [Xanthomonas euroxanthea]
MNEINIKSAATSVQSQAERIAMSLRTLKPNPKRQKEELFALLYPVITELMDQGITQKAILAMLSKKGLKLHPARFKELLEQHAKETVTSDVEDAA